MLAASFRVSSAVRVRLCKRMELRHVPRERHLACMRPAIALCRAAISGHHSLHFPPTTQEGLASTPAHRRQSFIGLFVWTRLISSDRCCHSILHARTAPQSTPLPLSSVGLLRRTSATSKLHPRDNHHQQHRERALSPCNPRQPQLLQYTAHYAPAAVVLAAQVPCRHHCQQQQRASEVAAAYTRATYISTSTTAVSTQSQHE